MARRKSKRSGIYIKPSRRGAFKKKGISVSQGLRSKNGRTRAQANFARMAKRGFKPLPSKRRVGRTHKVKAHKRVISRGHSVRVKSHRRRNAR